ncbi:MAG: hypothetical protein RMJ30_07980, partial [Nitrososphaerota archaeon]|nr:hypothetical protein [Nitrososphaerota archaeon]
INVKHEGGSENSLTLHTLESIASKIPLPALRFDASAVADSASVVKAVKTCQTFGSTTRISIAKPYISFTSKSESGRAEVKLSAEEVDGEASASFNASYLEKITRAASKISNKNRLELSTNKPLKISCTIPSGKLEYLIAPIIQSIHTIEMTPTAAKHWNNVDTTFFF